ncbi:MAG: hypothetical protein AMJ68_03150 [Acidithiobacillales bacterium SG8_45]|jgi:hypothetical protein|nr:MAG: hypothetical protein AMJ68_03150 [Acidithiobacillales bacterium SG8_45]
MHDTGTTSTVLIVAAVLLFFFLGIAILILMDHKARIPGGFKRDPFSISGMRRDHPVEAFVTATILLGIILALALSLFAALTGRFGLFEEKEPPKLLSQLEAGRSAERLRHFHNYPEQLKPTLGNKNVCFFCHGDYPHSKEPMIRTILNMHTQFAGCLTCHADARKVPEKTMTLRWLNYSGIETKGPKFGTDVDPNSGYLIETDDYYSKIVAYSTYQGPEILLEITSDSPEAKEFSAIHETLSDRDREAVKKTFHRIVSPKGRFCSRCHTDENRSYIPFRKLGFSDQRMRDLTSLNIIGLVEKYREFYMPNLLRSDKSIPPIETLTGDKGGKKSGADVRDDPRQWWKQMYDTK